MRAVIASLCIAAVAAVMFLPQACSRAEASPLDAVGMAELAHQGGPADLLINELRAGTATCTTSARLIAPSAGSSDMTAPAGIRAASMQIQNRSTSAIRLGGSDVTRTTGIELCDGCAADELWSGNVSRAYCIIDSSHDAGVTIEVAWGPK